ncbi:DUF2809 domain-containing protein [Leeuwenhoekiella sp. W20_SRS_FM14]|uniref:ribosomal maturation YjgA family protein n=1 Tax=Leeuwenhoekiella sp. W20_SRS_FM14 TaxID=3240270 RepID=UPI003F949D24
MKLIRNSRLAYLLGFVFILILEIAIAIYLKTGFIRANLGDFLVAILLYCLLMTVSNTSVKNGLFITLVFSFIIEFLQIINLTQFFPIAYKKWAALVFGSHFSWLDVLMYTLGILTIWGVEYAQSSRPNSQKLPKIK